MSKNIMRVCADVERVRGLVVKNFLGERLGCSEG